MGNCQAAEAATVVIQHPGCSKVDRIYWSVSAHEVMSSNPGHYVAMVVTSPPPGKTESGTGTPVRQMKLLRPDDTLLLGHVYRLISFEDVLKEFATKKGMKLGKLLRERGASDLPEKKQGRVSRSNSKSKSENGGSTSTETEQHETQTLGFSGSSSSSMRGVRRLPSGGGAGQWRPALQSIAEIGT